MASKKALFICLGNICRSPIAEAVFIDEVKKSNQESNWEIDSAAIGSWHVGKDPDRRALATMKKHNLAYNNKARQIQKDDFKHYDYIFGMDEQNIADLKSRCPKDGTAKILMLGDFDPEGDRIIRDPYYDDGSEGFEKCYVQSVRCCKAFLEQVAQN
ncbi:low molecular weight phosphotyrosine protein phosphatase 1-like [Contarinia nasturtii]|uniref:low molecular weight phosphotyrosine protein phosphatase 1-like n=1 Tax=Contarinia nasturtii TaxID=265458 RepID=UPI0012D43255|nr:low molecular weight phosphotyrosine protein phosphatase 1-like [Contarinia nasturtii]